MVDQRQQAAADPDRQLIQLMRHPELKKKALVVNRHQSLMPHQQSSFGISPALMLVARDIDVSLMDLEI